MRLIGLIGKARVGKDTVAEYLHEHHLFNRRAFADPLKTMLASVFGNRFDNGDREQPIEWLGKSPRQLMQTLGTEWGRNCVHPDLWVLLAEREWAIHTASRYNREHGINLVFTDVRFHNEADMILRQGGELWQILRPEAFAVNEHVSELADWSAYPRRLIHNDGTLDDLYTLVSLALTRNPDEPLLTPAEARTRPESALLYQQG